jgi:hypothetical protein
MFERYSDRARRSVVLAQDEARALGHPGLGTDCLLLGLAAEGEGVAGQALAGLGAGAEGLRKAIAARTPPGIPPAGGHLQFTRAAKKALEMALRESLRLGHNFIGTEHLLLGLLRVSEDHGYDPCGVALESLGVKLDDVRDAVMALLRGYGEGAAGRPVRVLAKTVGEDRQAIGDLLGIDPGHVRHYAMTVEAGEGTIVKFCCDDRIAAAQMLVEGAHHVMASPGTPVAGSPVPPMPGDGR